MARNFQFVSISFLKIISENFEALFEGCGTQWLRHCATSHKVAGSIPWTAVQHTSPHRTHAHTLNIMLPHHHIDFFTFLTNFKISDFPRIR